jgi:hypothetical protein
MTSAADLSAPATCQARTTSTLAGASLAVQGPCTLTQAQALAGVTYPYQLVIAAAIDNVVPQARNQTCPTPDRSGLYLFGQISGGGQTYCRCDNGLCPPPDMKVVTLHAGTFTNTFDWRGRNWFGPSDTNNQEGAPFHRGATPSASAPAVPWPAQPSTSAPSTPSR